MYLGNQRRQQTQHTNTATHLVNHTFCHDCWSSLQPSITIGVTLEMPGKAKAPLKIVQIQKESNARIKFSHLLQALHLDVGILHLLMQTEVQRPLAPVLSATLLPLHSHECLQTNTACKKHSTVPISTMQLQRGDYANHSKASTCCTTADKP